MAEFDLIARIRQRVAERADVALGIGDDCALLLPPPGMQLAVTMDTLNAGVHFPADAAPFDIGWKSLAVNLSDLAAMGAQPAWCTLSLTLPQADPAFVEGFVDGFFALAAVHGIGLVGGDTTGGPLAVSITAHGHVEPAAALRRDGARPGDALWVSGCLGDAAAGLDEWRAGGPRDPVLRGRMERPQPRVALGRALRGVASACIDVSDGLLADLAHVCRASAVAAVVEADALPTSPSLRARLPAARCRELAAAGGDDYELCFTAPAGAEAAVLAAGERGGVAVTRIGRIEPGAGLRCVLADGAPWQPPRTGWEHFAAG